MQIQEVSRISKVFPKPWIFLEFLESAWILGFSGKSLLKERIAEMILGKCEFKKIYHIFLKLTLTIYHPTMNCHTP